MPVGRDLIEDESRATIAHVDVDFLVDLGVHTDRTARMFGRVENRLGGCRDEFPSPIVERAVAHAHDFDSHGVVLLDACCSVLQGRGQGLFRVAAGLVEPRAQVAFFGARQAHHAIRIVGVPADERECLQYRVVHLGGQLGAGLRPDPFLPLVSEFPVEARDPRHRDE